LRDAQARREPRCRRSRAAARVAGLRSELKGEESADRRIPEDTTEKTRRPRRGPTGRIANDRATKPRDPPPFQKPNAGPCPRSRAAARVVGLRSKLKEEESAARRIPGDICGEDPPPASRPHRSQRH